MAGKRIDLHNIFIDILGTTGQKVSRVYFQPPASIKLEYPCIIYRHSDEQDFFSDDSLYLNSRQYLVTVIDKNPDSEILDKVHRLRYCDFSTSYAVDGLNHTIYTLYY